MLIETFPEIVLASASPSRAALLRAAGVEAVIEPADVDERAIRAALQAEGDMVPGDVAEVLARAKAETVSARRDGTLVIGADQILELEGRIFEKPQSMEDARRTLLDLSGRTHTLHASVCMARDGDTFWSFTGQAHMTMRPFDAAFVGQYLAQAGDMVLSSVGAYQLEGLGAHLFSQIEGDYFTILGLPLLPLLESLRNEGAILS